MRPLFRSAAFLAAFVLVVSLFSSLTTVSATAAEGACATVKKNTAKKFKKRTKAVKQTRKKFRAAKKKLKAAKRNGAKKAVRVKLTKKVKQTRKKFTAAKKKRKPVVRKRKQVCAPAHRLVSVSTKGVPGNAESTNPQVSANDRFVVFESEATNLVPGDTNRSTDVFVRDRLKRTTTRVSVQNNGQQVKWGGSSPAISADGRYVAFASNSPDLGVPAPANIDQQPAGIFVRDLVAGTTTRASYAADGKSHFNHWPRGLSISDDGRHIAFDSFASNVVPGYTPNDMISAYVVDRVARKNHHASVTPAGVPTNAWVWDVQISGNGRFVVYSTDASNYIPGRGQKWDYKIFMWDRNTGVSRIVSVNPDGTAMEMASQYPSISADGQFVLFEKKKVTNWTPTSATMGRESLQWYDRLAPVGSYTRKVADGAYGSSLAPDATFMAYKVGSDGFIKNVKTGKEFWVGGLGKKPLVDGFLANFSLSNGGRALAFSSEATNVVKKKTPAQVEQVYVRIR